MQPDKGLSQTEVKDVRVFDNDEFGKLRTVAGDGAVWLVAADVATALGYSSAKDLARTLDDDEKGRHLVPTIKGVQELIVINEAGFYKVVLQRKAGWIKDPERRAVVERFQRWVTHEVLPAIRRDGGYIASRDGESPEELMARALKVADATLRRQAAQIEEMRPKALFADAVSASDRSILVGDLAKILKQNGVDTGRQRLFAKLHEDGFLMWSHGVHMPTQRAMEMGLFEVKEHTGLKPDGSAWTSMTVCVTGRGQVYFVNRYCRGAA